MKNFNAFRWKITDPIEKNPGNQLCEFITSQVLDHGMPCGARLPSQRKFAKINNLNLNTVKRVYNKLSARGLINCVPGLGTFVSREADGLRTTHPNKKFTLLLPLKLHKLPSSKSEKPAPVRDFLSIGLDVLGPVYTPYLPMSKYLRKHQNRYTRVTQMEHIIDIEGLDFREAIRKYLHENRGLWLERGYLDIVFTRAAALRKLLGVLLQPGTALVNTCPQDEEFSGLAEAIGAVQFMIKTTEHDFIIQLETILRHAEIKLLYIRSQCGYPEGNFLDSATSKRLVELAKQYQFYLLEEDPYHEFWYGAYPFRPLCNYDHQGHVIYLSVLSQISVYMLNTYVICACKEFIDLLQSLPKESYPFRNLVEERAIMDMLNSGELLSCITEAKKEKAKEKEDLEYNLNYILGEHITIQPALSGLSLWILFAEHVDLQQMMSGLEYEKIRIPYDPDHEQPQQRCHQMRLGFGTYNRAEALDAAKVLLRLLEAPAAVSLPRRGFT